VRRRAAFAPLALLALLAGCATNPVTGKKELALVSESQELDAGKQSLAATEAEYGDYDDTRWAARVDSLGHGLAAVSHRPTLAWQFHVIDDPAVNAFAAPGGYIFITRGILAHLGSYAQLAGVMGHEIGHVTARHYVRQASRQQLFGLGLGVAQAVSPTVAKFGNEAQQGLGILFLKYSRDQEAQADELGVTYSYKDGYDPRQIPATYHTLARIAERAGARTPTYLSTHPDPLGREVTTRAQADGIAGTRQNLRVDHEAYLRALDGLVYGDDPRQGYFEGDRFYQPTLRFLLDFPAGWQHQNGHSAVLAAPAGGGTGTVLQLTAVDLRGGAPGEYVDRLKAQGRVTTVVGSARTLNDQPGWLGRVATTDDNGAPLWLELAIVEQSPASAYQLVGQMEMSTTNDLLFQRVANSFHALTDPARLDPVPQRVRVVPAPRTGLFQDVVPTLGGQGISLAETAIVNGMDLDDQVRKGELIKIVTPMRLR
jgi:predicted Zn-dependent protease